MAGSSSVAMLILLFVAMNSASLFVDAISCQGAITRMLPCQAYLMGVGGITVPCCQSAQTLSQVAKATPENFKLVCQCLKQAALLMGINMGRAQQIPQLCHIDVAAGLIDPNVDCNKFNAQMPAGSSRLGSSQMKSYDPDQIGIPVIAPSSAH
ncbi:putative non-specific lipid-transfer protein 3 [Artemisia annua]|uniref:Putative non-specific lipid-transfer protein 3 n=1 Tax=Artemisia annua TaxID=35608 RepID=A0A2U1M7A4_ARTAN|nr:putative non-specific lipid-transfer protein 3 [Artemisia annua]